MTELTTEQLQKLRDAKEANPFWFDAVIRCAEVMVPRRGKYAGSQHSYFNFVDLAKRMSMDIMQVFLFYVNIKLSRIGVTAGKNFEDEKWVDSWIDLANYALLGLGWLVGRLTFSDVENNVPYSFSAATPKEE